MPGGKSSRSLGLLAGVIGLPLYPGLKKICLNFHAKNRFFPCWFYFSQLSNEAIAILKKSQKARFEMVKMSAICSLIFPFISDYFLCFDEICHMSKVTYA